MNEQGHSVHLLRDGELVDAFIAMQVGPGKQSGKGERACHVSINYDGSTVTASGADLFDAMVALRGTLALEGLFLNVLKATRCVPADRVQHPASTQAPPTASSVAPGSMPQLKIFLDTLVSSAGRAATMAG